MSNIVMGTVNSDAIAKIGFSGKRNERGTLRVEFTDGSRGIEYADVPYAVYRRFVLSHSHGAFYNTEIRSKFKTAK